MKVLIIGVNGFIGSNLATRILDETDWSVYGMDMGSRYVNELRSNPRFHFTEGDLCINNEWVEYHIKKCDIILPLVAIATPKAYVDNPLGVFELNFEANLKVVRWAVKYGKRLIFPSTSEVYGMAADESFSETKTNLVYGPIDKVRWIYACSKQMLDRLIYAYGRDHGLDYTCFRPFNWIGPKLDSITSARLGNSRVLTQFISDLADRKAIQLVGGGSQKRCFLDVDDGLDALMTILNNKEISNHRIFNIGAPANEMTIKDLAEMTQRIYAEEMRIDPATLPKPVVVTEKEFYGEGFQDINHRSPDITAARETLGWSPKVPLEESIRKSVRFFSNMND